MTLRNQFAYALLGTLAFGTTACGDDASSSSSTGPGASGGNAGEATGGDGGDTGSGGSGSGGDPTTSGGAGTGGAGTGGADTGGAGTGGADSDAGAPMGGTGGMADAGGGGEDAGPLVAPDPAGVVGYMYVNIGTAAGAQTLGSGYSYNASGGSMTAERTAVGSYRVIFDALAIPARNVQVTAYNSDGYCSVLSNGNTTITLTCRDSAGDPADTPFSLLALGDSETNATVAAYGYADKPAVATYAAPSAFNHTGGAVTASRSAAGAYGMTFDGVAMIGANVQISALNSSNHCTVTRWNNTDGAVTACYDDTGALDDTRYLAMVVQQNAPNAAQILGYMRTTNGDDPTNVLADTDQYFFNSAGGGVSSTHPVTGVYDVMFEGVDASNAHAQVTSYVASTYCNVTSVSTDSVRVACFDAGGGARNARFGLLIVE